MNGKIVIDGFVEENSLSLTIHGEEKPDDKAVASLIMDINKNEKVRDLLVMMLDYVDRSTESEE